MTVPESAGISEARRFFDRIPAIITAMRPRQWSKNLFVFIALLFTNNVPSSLADSGRMRMLGLSLAAFALFSLLSGAVYLVNDVADRERDRLHPIKRTRPIASGRLPWQTAVAGAVLLAGVSVWASFQINAKFGLVSTAYLCLQMLYTAALKHMVLVDVFAIAAGFVLRAAAGAYAIQVPNSVWLLICTLQLALFLGFGKRRHELVSLAEDAESHRRNLAEYTVPLLDQIIAIVLAGFTCSYAIYSVTSPTAMQHPRLWITFPNVLYGIFRYLYLIHVEHKGGSPEAVLMEDRPMQLNLLLWLGEVIYAFKYS